LLMTTPTAPSSPEPEFPRAGYPPAADRFQHKAGGQTDLRQFSECVRGLSQIRLV